MQDKFFVVKTEFNKLRVLPPNWTAKKTALPSSTQALPCKGCRILPPFKLQSSPGHWNSQSQQMATIWQSASWIKKKKKVKPTFLGADCVSALWKWGWSRCHLRKTLVKKKNCFLINQMWRLELLKDTEPRIRTPPPSSKQYFHGLLLVKKVIISIKHRKFPT